MADLKLSLVIGGEVSGALDGLKDVRTNLLNTYSEAKRQVESIVPAMEAAKAKAKELAVNLGNSGPPTKALVADFEKARASARDLASAYERGVVSLLQARQAARENAAAISEAARAERDWAAQTQARATAAAAASRNMANSSSLGVLGTRSGSDIRGEMTDTLRALASLKANGAAAQDIARAAQAAQLKIAALNAELKGTSAVATGAGNGMEGLAGRLAIVATAAMAVREAIGLLKSSVETGVRLDSMKTTYAFGNGGDLKKAAEEMAYARELSNRLGLELLSTTQAYGKLMAAARGTTLEGQATRDIFKAVASAGAVMGLTADQQSGALLAISQMMSKGTVAAEELRGQLGEHLPGAFKIAAQAMRMTEAEFNKMLENGDLAANTFLPKFAEALQKAVSDQLPNAEKSARAQLQRLENAFTEFKARIAQSGLLDKLAEQLERFLQHLGNMADSGELQRLAQGFADAFGAVIKFLTDAAILAERFSGTLGTLATVLASVMVGGKALAFFAEAGTGLAAAGAAAGTAAGGFTLLATAFKLLRSLTVGGLILVGVEELIKWGAGASEAREKAMALEAALRKLIDTNSQYASAAMLDADGMKEFGDTALDAYEKAIKGARDYAAAKVVDLTQRNDKGLPKGLGKFDDAIEFYRQQSAAYNEHLDTVVAGERLRREQVQLTGQVLQLEAEREKILAGDVKKTKVEALAEQIKGYEKLVDTIRKAREESQKEAEEAKKSADSHREKASEKKTSAEDKANSIREKNLSQEDQQALANQRAKDALSEGEYYAAAAAAALLDGRGKAFEDYAKKAESFLDRASKFAESSQNADLVEEIGKQQANLEKTLAKADDKKADDAEQRAAGLMDQLNQAQQKLSELKGEAATIKVNAEITDAISKLADVENKLAALKDKTVTVTLNTVNTDQANAPTGDTTKQPLPAFARGGPLPGVAPHDTADNMLYMGTPGEWVIRLAAVRHYGPAFLASINSMSLPKYATGGRLNLGGAFSGGSVVSRLSIPSIEKSTGSSPAQLTPINLNFPEFGKSLKMQGSPDIEKEVLNIFRIHAARFGKR